MAANGIQFTEQQLNAMVQQQLLTQQNYRQWVMALSPEQQIMLQQQMQGRLHQVKVQMAQMMQHTRLEVSDTYCNSISGVLTNHRKSN